MSIEATIVDRSLTIKLSGEIGHDAAVEMHECAKNNISSKIDLVKIDMSDLKYIASTGLGTLVGIRLLCKKAKSRITIKNPSNEALDALHLSNLDKIFEIKNDN